MTFLGQDNLSCWEAGLKNNTYKRIIRFGTRGHAAYKGVSSIEEFHCYVHIYLAWNFKNSIFFLGCIVNTKCKFMFICCLQLAVKTRILPLLYMFYHQ